MKHSMLLFVVILTVLSISLCEAEKEISCEERNVNAKKEIATCNINLSAIIDFPGYRITSNRNETIETMRFESNKRIQFLPVSSNDKFPNLAVIDACNCSIQSISKENFNNLTKLKKILLSYNEISEISNETFEGLASLEEISLGEFSINSADPD